MSVNLQHNMLLLVYQHVLLEVNQQQHVVVGIYYNLHLQHLHIKESPETTGLKQTWEIGSFCMNTTRYVGKRE